MGVAQSSLIPTEQEIDLVCKQVDSIIGERTGDALTPTESLLCLTLARLCCTLVAVSELQAEVESHKAHLNLIIEGR